MDASRKHSRGSQIDRCDRAGITYAYIGRYLPDTSVINKVEDALVAKILHHLYAL
eukprot:XP_001706371.1 Hypothetical protein GL50803_37609 [Giardia lamblia ATCC 50803]